MDNNQTDFNNAKRNDKTFKSSNGLETGRPQSSQRISQSSTLYSKNRHCKACELKKK